MMAKTTLQDFLLDRNVLAVKISSKELTGVFRKSLSIPLNTAGLALFDDGTCSLFREGQEVTGKFDLILVKEGEVQLRLIFPDLRTSDGLSLSAVCTFTAAISTTRPDLFKDFCRTLFTFPGTYGTSELKNHVATEIRRLLADYVSRRPDPLVLIQQPRE